VVTLEVRNGDILVLEIDPDDGLTRDDIDSACGLLSADDFSGEAVRVEVCGPSTTDLAVLRDLQTALAEQLHRWGRVVDFHISVPPSQGSW